MDTRKVLITGASRGIGRSVADRLAAQGCHVIGLARTPPKDIFPGEFHTCDLSKADECSMLISDLAARHDILEVVNNVGIVAPAPVDDLTIEAFDKVIGITIHPAIIILNAVLPAMRAANWGRIVNITSLAVLGTRERSSYAAAKAGLGTLTRIWALELATNGITVNAVAPGPTETVMFSINNPPGSEAERRARARVPMGRLGKPHEIAAAVEFFLSKGASFVTGQTLYVDGGSSIGMMPSS